MSNLTKLINEPNNLTVQKIIEKVKEIKKNPSK